jgi:hypothetical protein
LVGLLVLGLVGWLVALVVAFWVPFPAVSSVRQLGWVLMQL